MNKVVFIKAKKSRKTIYANARKDQLREWQVVLTKSMFKTARWLNRTLIRTSLKLITTRTLLTF